MIVLVALMPMAVAAPSMAGRDASGSARLTVTTRFLPSQEVFVEGAFYYVEVRRPSDGSLISRGRNRASMRTTLAPGRYRLHAYARACAGMCPRTRRRPPCKEATCPADGHLGGRTDGCARGLRIRPATTVRATVLFQTGRHCRIHR